MFRLHDGSTRQISKDGFHRLRASCHCGAVVVEVPRRPRSLKDCNCSRCRRYGAQWAYYRDADMCLIAAPDAVDDCFWGKRTQPFIRCKGCGCVMQWKKLMVGPASWTDVNARNFESAALGNVRICLLDGAGSWKYVG